MSGGTMGGGRLIWRRGRCETDSGSHLHQVGERARLHLSHHVASVCLHCDSTDARLATDLRVQPAGDHQVHDLPFATGEGCVTLPNHPYLRLVTQRSTTVLDAIPDRGQQDLIAEWLRQELVGSRLHRLHTHWHVAVCRDEDERHLRALRSDAPLQIQAVQVRKRHVQYQTTRPKGSWASEEFLGGRECLWLPARAADQ